MYLAHETTNIHINIFENSKKLLNALHGMISVYESIRFVRLAEKEKI